MKTLQSYQECGHLIGSCIPVVFTCHPEVRVAVEQQPWPSKTVKVKMYLAIGDTTLGIAENEYASLDALLEAFEINECDEMWEVLE